MRLWRPDASYAIPIRQTGSPPVPNWTPIKVGEPESGQVRLRQAVEARATPGSTVLTI